MSNFIAFLQSDGPSPYLCHLQTHVLDQNEEGGANHIRVTLWLSCLYINPPSCSHFFDGIWQGRDSSEDSTEL